MGDWPDIFKLTGPPRRCNIMGKDKKMDSLRAYFRQKNRKRKMGWLCVIFICLFPLLLFAMDYHVGIFSRGKMFDEPATVPHCRAAVVLGCSKYTQGRLNLYYQYRIDAAVELWQAGKIDAILVSGDNSRKDYDEPSSMKADLVERGIPPAYIAIDYAGFRTLDSVVRAQKVFALEDYVVISQPFHCRRAIYLANKTGQSVIGYCARDVAGVSGAKVRLRETLARAKAVLDVAVSRKPKYLGPRETIHYRPAADE
jgi:SanA protein